MYRFLAAALDEDDGPTKIDYSVLSVAVMTLSLIMIVEALRHRLDVAAIGRPFFSAVLEGVYTELSTLGMVELVIWLLHQYYKNLDLAKEQVFAKVHFTLFYMAIFNAFQSVIVAFFAGRVSRSLWIRTETLELSHYVEIREEFQKVHDELERLKQNWKGVETSTKSASSDEAPEPENSAMSSEEPVTASAADNHRENSGPTNPSIATIRYDDFIFDFTRKGVKRVAQGIVDQIRFPQLKRRYHRLLVQVRFHELRVHFIQAYKLPNQLKISDYLMRSEMVVLIRLVHISMTAWLLLTGAVNLLFYVMGIVAYETERMEFVGRALTWIFYSTMVAFVLFALLIFNKMKRIFSAIMHQTVLWGVDVAELQDQLAIQQLDLFWFGFPKMVIASIQFMQVGYAMALSVIFVFWTTIAEGVVAIEWYILVVAISYAIFVLVVAKVIPWYTLCTSLGQLVDKRRLHDTFSAFRLEEARRKRMEQLEWTDTVAPVLKGPSKSGGGPPAVISTLPRPRSPFARDGSGGGILSHQASFGGASSVSADKDSADLMAALVRLDTESLRESLPAKEREALVKRMERRRGRRKSVSDGVGFMARINNAALAPLAMSVPVLPGRIKDDSDIDRGQRAVFVRNNSDKADVAPGSNDILSPDDTKPASLRERRRTRGRRRKSVSDGVALMSAVLEEPSSSERFLPELPEGRLWAENSDNAEGDDEPGLAPPVVSTVQSDSTRSSGSQELACFFGPPISPEVEIPLPRPSVENPNDRFDFLFPLNTSRRIARGIQPANVGHGRELDGNLVPLNPSRPPGPMVRGLSTESIMTKVPPKAVLSRDISDASAMTKAVLGHGVVDKNADGDDSMASTRSIGALSDTDDIPEVNPATLVPLKGAVDRLTVRQRLHSFFLDVRFVRISNVFGTMVAFYMVGQRVEGFLSSQGIINEGEYITFDFPTKTSFWILFTWLLLFLVTDGCVIWSLGRPIHRLETPREQRRWLAAVLDVALTVFCLIMFCVAEVKRCCTTQASRSLAEIQTPYDNYIAQPPTCSCPMFGSRQYGGLGVLEPFVSLISLRIFRFWLARLVLSQLETGFLPKELMSGSVGRSILEATGADEGRAATSMEDEQGTVCELWQTAVSRYPDVVAKYGEFSGELLQTMLGLPLLDTASFVSRSDLGMKGDSASLSSMDRRYPGLSPHAQQIIILGQTGRSFKRPASPAGYGATFSNDALFQYPNARLVRSMRRCDRKLIPILEKWSVVDVVMTRYEIVYFDASDIDDAMLEPETEDVKEAIIATRGGKGLRLKDVSTGRRVAGILQICDIDYLGVYRILPHPLADGDTNDETNMEVRKAEYWQVAAPEGGLKYRAGRWSTVKQDVLKIRTVDNSTLCVRFYCDLDDAEANPERTATENELQGPLFKNNAFQWVQTIARFCGTKQLKQSLPNFDTNTPEELRDFLTVIPKEETIRDFSHRRISSSDVFRFLPRRISTANFRASGGISPPFVAVTDPIPGGAGGPKFAAKKPELKRSSSGGNLIPKPKPVRRLTSMDDHIFRRPGADSSGISSHPIWEHHELDEDNSDKADEGLFSGVSSLGKDKGQNDTAE